jgi:hypothetical protein
VKTQPLVSDPVSTRCLTPAHRDTNYICVKCEQPTAHWRVFHARYGEESQPICALCFFKTSDWVGENRQRFDLVVKAVGLRRKVSLQRDELGDLVSGKDADDVLGAIVLHDRFQSLTQRAE